jgi:hypothetical protein
VAFAETSDCGIARHCANGRKAMGDERSLGAKARGGRRRLAAGVSSAHDNDVEVAIHALQALARRASS